MLAIANDILHFLTDIQGSQPLLAVNILAEFIQFGETTPSPGQVPDSIYIFIYIAFLCLLTCGANMNWYSAHKYKTSAENDFMLSEVISENIYTFLISLLCVYI